MALNTKNENAAAGREVSGQFFRYFQIEISALQEQVESLTATSLVGSERKDAADQCLAGITKLAAEVNDASADMPSHDQRTYNEAIKNLQERYAQSQAVSAPKQKFSFKPRKNNTGIPLNNVQRSNTETLSNFIRSEKYSSNPALDSVTSEASDVDSVRHIIKETSISISSKRKTYASIPEPHSSGLPCLLSDIHNCYIEPAEGSSAKAPFASLTINQISSSLLLCNSIDGPAHITGVHNSTILLSCRQFRMHECENLDVYIHCTSRPIIEDCKNIGFAPLPTFYLDMIHPSTQLQRSKNMYDQVDDFKWLMAEQSPNWFLLSPDKQIPKSSWHKIIPYQPELALETTLEIARVPVFNTDAA